MLSQKPPTFAFKIKQEASKRERRSSKFAKKPSHVHPKVHPTSYYTLLDQNASDPVKVNGTKARYVFITTRLLPFTVDATTAANVCSLAETMSQKRSG
jgi:hypothetical protein